MKPNWLQGARPTTQTDDVLIKNDMNVATSRDLHLVGVAPTVAHAYIVSGGLGRHVDSLGLLVWPSFQLLLVIN